VKKSFVTALAVARLGASTLELPGDLANQHNVLVLAFRREQQRVVDQWLPWLIDLEQRRSDVGFEDQKSERLVAALAPEPSSGATAA
jgi:hypothetical protein